MKRQPINKDNYEEYFLLYVDNELTPAEKASVEAFIEEHPGLKTELDMFLATRLDMEDVKMEGVEDLYKYDEKDLINGGNIEEFQVLSIDNELTNEEQEALDSFHKNHPEAASNFEWLKKTKLPVEEIAFPDKSSLYRTEKKPASIISITWIRYAAAAAVILLAGLFWISNDSNEITPAQQAEVREAESQRERESGGNTNVIAQANTNDTDSGSLPGNSKPIETPAGEQVSGPVQVAMTPAKATQAKEAITITAANNDQKFSAKGSDRPAKEPMAIVENQQIAAVEKNETRISAEDLRLNKTTEPSANATPYVQPAVAMNVKTNYAADALSGIQDDDDVEMDTEGEGKQRRGLRGIVRKANRIYNKVTNPDLDRPLVKVANLEIGLQR